MSGDVFSVAFSANTSQFGVAVYRRDGDSWYGRWEKSEKSKKGVTHFLPENYQWSSVHANAYGQWEKVIDPHDAYDRLSCEHNERLACYKALLDEAINEDELNSIRAHVNQGKVYGSTKFQEQIRELTGRRVELRPMGRPRKSKTTEK